MADGQDNANTTRRLGFKTVRLMKDQTLGIGSYGKVCKAKCDELICAAKLMHETLFDPTVRQQDNKHRLPIERFERECEFLSAVRHPNIIQYLGVYHDVDTNLPALLMELMDGNLTHYLEISTQSIPYHIQVSICYDITLALSFLHTNGIIHRDLSGNNVLLFGNIRAKVTDFGMARLDGLNPNRTTRPSYTTCPGSDVYMPPETVKAKPIYNEKVDCFSFGVIIVQILTRKFPEPGDRQKEIQINHPGVHAGVLEVRVSELERRQNHISTIDQKNMLLPIALDCLKDKQEERPSAQELNNRLAVLKDQPSTTQREDPISQSQVTSTCTCSSDVKDREIKRLREELQLQAQQKDHVIETTQRDVDHVRQELEQAERLAQEEEQRKKQVIAGKDEEIQRLKQMLQEAEQRTREVNQLAGAKDEANQERETKQADESKQLEMSEQARLDIERRLHEVEQQLRQSKSPHRRPSYQNKKSIFQLKWSEGENAPRKMYRECNVITNGNSMYFQANSDEVHAYSTSSSRWTTLPRCRYQGSSLAIVNGLLTAMGGEDVYVTGYSTLFTLENAKQWTETLPPMQVARTHSMALCTGTALIVAGGWNETSVEVMNTETQKWSNAAHLPEPVYNASITICGDRLYVLGGYGPTYEGVMSVLTCSLSTLLQSCSADFPDSIEVWTRIADLPVTNSTCVSLNGRLLAIGGIELTDQPACTTAVYMYNSTANAWEIVSHMQVARSHCYAAVLPDNRLMVVGGKCDPKGNKINEVEFATMN